MKRIIEISFHNCNIKNFIFIIWIFQLIEVALTLVLHNVLTLINTDYIWFKCENKRYLIHQEITVEFN